MRKLILAAALLALGGCNTAPPPGPQPIAADYFPGCASEAVGRMGPALPEICLPLRPDDKSHYDINQATWAARIRGEQPSLDHCEVQRASAQVIVHRCLDARLSGPMAEWRARDAAYRRPAFEIPWNTAPLGSAMNPLYIVPVR